MSSIVDFSYLEEMADGKADFVKQVLSIFMDNTPPGLKELEQMIQQEKDLETIQKQAHFLKSSFGIVKVEGMSERLQQIETLARENKERNTIEGIIKEATTIFAEAEGIIKRKMEQ